MNPCLKCNALCCRYVTIPIDKPKTKEDFESIRWYVAHKNVIVYQDHDNDWFVEFITDCEFLEKNKCSIHPNNPNKKNIRIPVICLEHSNKECELHGNPYKKVFRTIKEVDEYLKRRWNRKK